MKIPFGILIAFSIILTLVINSLSFEEASALVDEFSGNSRKTQKILEQCQYESENEKSKYLFELQKVQKKVESLSQELRVLSGRKKSN